MAQTVVITGVGEGLGASLARKFAREGYQVGMFARSADYLGQLQKEITKGGGQALGVPTNITDAEQVGQGFNRVRESFGPVDILINHAGNATWAGLLDLKVEEFEQAWRVGPYGSFLCTREAVPDMLKKGSGTILFSGATSSIRGRGGALAFSSAKFGVRGLAESLARELWPKNIHVAHVIIDGGIGSSQIAKDSSFNPDEAWLNPDSMADTYWMLVNQEHNAWTLEVDLRPFNEDFFV